MNSDLLQLWARGMSWTLVALILLMLLLLFGLRLYRRYAEPIQRVRAERQSSALMQCALGDEYDMTALTVVNRHRWELLQRWLHVQMSVHGPANERLAALGRQLGLATLAVTHVESRHYAKRMVALLSLGFLHQTEQLQLLRERMQQGHSHTAIYAGRAMLQIDAATHAETVARILLEKAELDLALTAVIFKPYRAALMPVMQALWQKHEAATPGHDAADDQWSLRWLRLARALQLQLPSDWLAPQLQDTRNVEALIAAIRLFQSENGLAPLLPLAQHPDWRVRAQVARALSYVGTRSEAEILVRMTTDAQWWVRFRSAQALLSLPGLDVEQVRQWVADTGDRYALQMMQAVIETEGVG
ncbi:MAG: hypothetical protein RIT26_98 [Pseudomonadota bacterium]|jgi:hypothetical protein